MVSTSFSSASRMTFRGDLGEPSVTISAEQPAWMQSSCTSCWSPTTMMSPSPIRLSRVPRCMEAIITRPASVSALPVLATTRPSQVLRKMSRLMGASRDPSCCRSSCGTGRCRAGPGCRRRGRCRRRPATVRTPFLLDELRQGVNRIAHIHRDRLVQLQIADRRAQAFDLYRYRHAEALENEFGLLVDVPGPGRREEEALVGQVLEQGVADRRTDRIRVGNVCPIT